MIKSTWRRKTVSFSKYGHEFTEIYVSIPTYAISSSPVTNTCKEGKKQVERKE
jgi:hypothetical protein